MNAPAAHDARVRSGALLGGFALLTALRAPWLVLAPRFFAEEGVLYFRYALDHGSLDSLTARHLGYFALVPNAATALAAQLPLASAPYATLAFAFAVQMLPAAVIIHDRSLFRTEREKMFALTVLLLPLAMRREWLSTIHAQFWLALTMCLMLVVPPRTRAASMFYAVITTVAAFTGALSGALAPLFVLLAFMRRDRRLFASGVVLGLGALFQAQSVVAARPIAWDPLELLAVAFGKLFVVPFAGTLAEPLTVALFERAHDPVTATMVGITAMLVVVGARRLLTVDGRILAFAAAFLGVASLIAALGSHAELARPMHGIRYVFVPHVVLGLLLVHGATHARAFRRPLMLALGTMLLAGAVGAASAARFHAVGVAYRDDANAYTRDPGMTLRVHDESCRLAPDAATQRKGFAVHVREGTSASHLRVEVQPAHLDAGADLRFFLVAASPAGDSLASFDGESFASSTVGMLGNEPLDRPGGCMFSDSRARFRTLARSHGAPVTLDLAIDELARRPFEGALFVGYGRDEADAIAKGTFVQLHGY